MSNLFNEMMEEISEKDQQIADLEAKLAEKDAEVQSWKDGTMVVNLGKLEEQLAEKEKVIEILRIDLKDWQDLEEKLGTKYDKVVEQLAENERKYEVLYKLFSEQHEIIDQYELECFEEVNRLLKEQKDFYVVEKDEYDKMVSGAKQFAKETAIAELEKVKGRFNSRLDNFYLPLDHRQTLKEVFEQIDQQIKELKGEKENV